MSELKERKRERKEKGRNGGPTSRKGKMVFSHGI